jgi:AcrR family transcriptional regulator
VALARSDRELIHTSRARLIAAGKSLFARVGYEQTSTAAIARRAGTSESQLVRYFEGKAGLLQTIFDESWQPLNERALALIGAAVNAREAILGVVSAFVHAFAQDPELAFLFLFEGRRLRGTKPGVILSKGFLAFEELTRELIVRGQKDGSFSKGFSAAAIASAVRGAVEGMIRDRLQAERSGKVRPFSEREIRRVLSAMLAGVSRTPPARRVAGRRQKQRFSARDGT